MSGRRSPYDPVAQVYDRARPQYPEALFADISAYADLGEGARLLEIGCGTGQATLPLARRGFTIDCIELGAEMAAVARAKLAGYGKVKVISEDFAIVDLRLASYDLVYAATAFHWLEPALGFGKAHELLKPGAALALFWHRPVMTERSRALVEALQAVYRSITPELAQKFAMPPQPANASTEYETLIPASGLFHDLQIRRHYVATEYSPPAYTQLLSTFSDHIALPARQREQLLAEIAALIRTQFAGRALRETVALLYLARSAR